MRKTDYLQLLKEELVEALGCTEPACVALAAAHAREQVVHALNDPSSGDYLDAEQIDSVDLYCSVNIYKNAMGVYIPGTNDMGAAMAAALGVVAGKASRGLQVLESISEMQIEEARQLCKSDKVKLHPAPSCEPTLYAEAVVCAQGHSGRAVIAWKHDMIVLLEQDGEPTFQFSPEEQDLSGSISEKDLIEVWDFVTSVDLEDLSIIREAIRLNEIIAEEGLNRGYGLEVGRAILNKNELPAFAKKISEPAFSDYCAARTAAAADARMAGSTLPVMANSGSGNQGLTVTVSVTAAAKYLGSSEEELIRAQTLSQLVAIHIKQSFGRLSPLCGATAAAVGSSAGMVMLLGGGLNHVIAAVQNMFGTVTGMICDGAKLGCALKVASCIYAAVQAALVAMRGKEIKPTDGVIEFDVENTIQNMERISKEGMLHMDDLLLNIMLNKRQTL